MAIIQGNAMVQGARGALGAVMYRRVGNRTILSAKPSSPKKESEQQKANRRKFKEATYYAKHILKDPQKKAYYQQKAKKLKLPNAYTAAITEYMRKGEIKQIAVRKTKSGNAININVHKKDFAVANVRVTIYNENGASVLCNDAVKKGPHEFVFHCPEAITLKPNMKITAEIIEHSWDRVSRSLVIS